MKGICQRIWIFRTALLITVATTIIIIPRTAAVPEPSSTDALASHLKTTSSRSIDDVIVGRTEHVCSNIDIRNQVSSFAKLTNCTTVEGFVQIILIEYMDEAEFRHLSFPKLREITGYLLLYRVYGLRTLSRLFPNLVVIRGQTLFFNYALVIFELPDIEEIGLGSLVQVVRGGARVEKNPKLCYISTVDWTKITGVKLEDNFFLQNKVIDECVDICPKNSNGSGICPEMEVTLHTGEKARQDLCWNAESCQKICPATCLANTCYESNVAGQREVKCCDPQCIGGCTGNGPSHCIACTNVFDNGVCLPKCPADKYEFHSRRCLDESECRAIHNWKLHDGKCIEDCPSGFMESRSDPKKCEKCQGHCPKVCLGLVIDNVAAAQKMYGCTIINGVLEIQIRGGTSLGMELEENLGMIEEITHYLKIVRSYALVSLRFLKSLRVIHGKRLHSDRYSMFVLDNQNLHDLWDLDGSHQNITIKNGSLFFHFNRKLCMNKINKFVEHVGKQDQVDHRDISPTSNGDQVACDIRMLDLEIMAEGPLHAIIRWKNFNATDPRELLSWVVNFRKASEGNITIYSSRDACGTDIWRTLDVKSDTDSHSPWIAAILYNLEPFTKYAVYVQTYSITTAKVGAMSEIKYFTTQPDTPSTVRDITVDVKYPGELHVSWKKPEKTHGNVTHYYVYWQSQSLLAEKFHQRDYCKDKLRIPSKTKDTATIIVNEKNGTVNGGECCKCPEMKSSLAAKDRERRYQIEFENFLHNSLYRKKDLQPASSLPASFVRKRRSLSSSTKSRNPRRKKRMPWNDSDIQALAKNSPEYQGLLQFGNNVSNASASPNPEIHEPSPVETHEAAIVYGTTEIILTNLKHFQEYSIEVIACHDYINGMDGKLCSNRAIISGRTLPNVSEDALDMRNITVTNGTGDFSNNVLFSWKEPTSPNGLIILFEIELVRVDVANFKPDILCIPHKQYVTGKGNYMVENLKSGNWKFRLRATSIAGSGPWTDYQHFHVADIVETSGPFNAGVITGIAVALLVFAILISFIVFIIVKAKFNARLREENLDRVTYNPNYAPEKEYEPDEWEVDRERIKIIRELGQGSFGMVYEGIAENLSDTEPLLRVAVKTVNVDAPIIDRYSFLNEASIMKAFNSYHVVKLLGVVSKGQPVLVVMELMSNGDLKTYLRLSRPDEPEKDNDLDPPTLGELLKWAGEIADGMAYLSSIKYVHRDLAARNCMVSADLVAKIGDFGMTRDIYATDYYRKGSKGLLPVRWMAPESLKDGVFTCRSDVWSYGVVLWEMATLAAQPYQGLSNEQVLHYVIDGSIMERPEGCPDRLYRMMLRCWKLSPKDRPTFYDIIDELSPDMPESFHGNSFYYTQQLEGVDDDTDFASADSVVTDAKDAGCCDDENDDLDLIHSKTPLHPTKSSLRNLSSTNCHCGGDTKPDMVNNSRGLPMPIQLPKSADVVVPSPVTRRRVSGSFSSALDEKTSLSNLDLNVPGNNAINRIAYQPPLPHCKKDCSVETTNDKLSCPDVKILPRGVVGIAQPDIIRAGLAGSTLLEKSGPNALREPHRNGLVNGVVLPPYS